MLRSLPRIIAYTLIFSISNAYIVAGESTSGGWEKSPASPVLGGDLGVCFDVTMIEEDGLFKMWFSWRMALSPS